MDNKEKNIEYYEGLVYDIVLRKNQGNFTLFIQELTLLVEDENLEKGHKELALKKEKYFLSMIKNGYQDCIVEPEGEDTRKTFRWNLIPFLIKTIVIFTIIIILLTTYNIKSNTFKYVKRASKSVVQVSKDISQTLNNIDEQAAKVIKTLDSHQIAKEREKLVSPDKLLVPVSFHTDNNLANYPVKHVFDSEVSTFWHSAKNEADLVVRFKLPSKLVAFSITSRNDIPGLQSPDRIIIECSNDNNNWKHYDQSPQIICEQGETKLVFLESNDKDYMYYKFNFIKFEDAGFISMAEMRLYGNYTKNLK
jgi:hypothetical protein